MEKQTEKSKFNTRRLTAILLLAAIFSLMAISPSYIRAWLGRDSYTEWMQIEKEPHVLIINVWHIVGFKPYIGSLGGWLSKRADEFKKQYVGIYFKVASLSPEQAMQQYERGMTPDIISFSPDACSVDALLPLAESFEHDGYCTDSGKYSDKLYALPYCASGELLLCDTAATAGMSREEIVSLCGSANDFKRGKTPACICDIRTAGDIYRAGLVGDAPYFEAESYAVPSDGGSASKLVQYVGINRDIDENKLPYAMEFLKYITSDKVQSGLGDIGLMPICTEAEPVYEQDWIRALNAVFDPYSIGGCFGQ